MSEQTSGGKASIGKRVIEWGVVIVAAVAILIGIRSLGAPDASADRVNWQPLPGQPAAGVDGAAKPMALYFGADWCPPCQRMRGEVFSQQRVAEAIEQDFVPVKMDLTDRSATDSRAHQMARRFQVRAVPTLILLSPQGEVLARRAGYIPADQLLSWMAQAEDTTNR